MKFDHYAFKGHNHFGSDLGEPVKVTRSKAKLLDFRKYKIVTVPKGTCLESVIIQAIINEGAHPCSFRCAKALKQYCGKKITMDISEE